MRFVKGHGTGNDFVLLPDAGELTPHLVAALCDRRRGIGGDGVLRVARGRDADWFMDYWNSDGSFAEMCGNGARVFARYLVSSGLATGPEVRIETRAGVVVAVVGDDMISVTMPTPRRYAESSATVLGRHYPGVAVDMGNPHLVCAAADLAAIDLTTVPGYDPLVFPAGVNVEFVVTDPEPVEGADRHVRMRVFERGSGETLSCGSGACAVAAVVLGGTAGVVAVDVPGGRLLVTLDGSRCWLAGPAVIVAEGTVSLPLHHEVGAPRPAGAQPVAG
jgi:diaminopimelate epimerase